MTLRVWLWLLFGMIAYTLVAYLWATGPYHCSAPDAHQRVTCHHPK